MKLHTDGTLEGTPDELNDYMKLKQSEPTRLCNWPPHGASQGISQASEALRKLDGRYSMGYSTNVTSQAQYDVNANKTSV